MDNLLYVGKSIPRKDGPLKATGRAQYTVDISLPGMLIGKVLRSPHPHARILSIDTSQAEKLPGVKAVVTAADSLQIKHGFVETPRYPADQYPIAVDTGPSCRGGPGRGGRRRRGYGRGGPFAHQGGIRAAPRRL